MAHIIYTFNAKTQWIIADLYLIAHHSCFATEVFRRGNVFLDFSSESSKEKTYERGPKTVTNTCNAPVLIFF